LYDDFAEMQAKRAKIDAGICDWAAGLTDDWFAGELYWFSGIAQCNMPAPRTIIAVRLTPC
jgi:hypothetical protein